MYDKSQKKFFLSPPKNFGDCDRKNLKKQIDVLKWRKAKERLSEKMKEIEKFILHWKERGYEKGEMQVFWLSFLRDVMEVANPEKMVKFE